MAIDPQLYHKVATQHGLIDSQLSGLRRAVESTDEAGAKRRLSSLGRAIEAHFKLEENHYYPAEQASRPEIQAEFERLVDEHGQLRLALARIADELDRAGWEAAASALAAFDASLHAHEEREQELFGA